MMNEYHSIMTVFKRDPENKYRTLIDDEFALPEFKYLNNNTWDYTEKVDGTNIRVMLNEGILSFGGKTDAAQIPATLVNKLNEIFLVEHLLTMFDHEHNVCLYGEGYGAKIQTGGRYRQDMSFVLFDVKVGQWWLQRENIRDVAQKLHIDIVPLIGAGTLTEMVDLVRGGFHSQLGNCEAEGIVARPQTELMNRSGHRIITKIKHKDFAYL